MKSVKTVMFEITDKCNLNCTHCMNRPDYKGIETSPQEFQALVSKFADHKAEKVYISGGEPLMHRHIKDIIEICKEFSQICFVITTNGLMLTPDLMMAIEESDNITLQFSIDGVSDNAYEATRGKGTFELFTEKMKIWDTLSKKQGLARTCLNKYNYKELPLIYEFCLNHRLLPSFIFLSHLGNGKKNWDDLELNLAQKMWCFDAINKLNNKLNINISTPEAPASCNFTENSGISSLIIRADGRVAPCQYFYDDSLGNIFEDEISEILESEWIEEHCKIAQKRKEILENSPKCKSCKIKDGCHFGCLGIASDRGDIMSYDGLCDLRVMATICYSNHLIAMNDNSKKNNTIRISREDD